MPSRRPEARPEDSPRRAIFRLWRAWQEGKAGSGAERRGGRWSRMPRPVRRGARWWNRSRPRRFAGRRPISASRIAAAEADRPSARDRSPWSRGLARELEQDGADLDGWLRLARARLVLGEPEKAQEALDRASELFRHRSWGDCAHRRAARELHAGEIADALPASRSASPSSWAPCRARRRLGSRALRLERFHRLLLHAGGGHGAHIGPEGTRFRLGRSRRPRQSQAAGRTASTSSSPTPRNRSP